MPSELGERLRRERVRRRETQDQTATRFKVSQPSYHRWESGETNPNDKHFGEIANFLGCKTDEVWKMVYQGVEPTSLDGLRQQIEELNRDMDDLRTIRGQMDEVYELRNEVGRLRAELDALRGNEGGKAVNGVRQSRSGRPRK